MKTVYCLKIRDNDAEPWSQPEHFRTRKQRDSASTMARCLGGFRTHSYEEKVDAEALEEIEFVEA